MEPSLATSVGTIKLDKPAMLASGILGISLDVFNRLYRSGAGAVVTKSLSSEPWEGYPNPTIFSVNGGGWINAVGLSNPGAPNFAKMIESNQDVPIIVSLVGSVPDDFKMMIEEFKNCNVTAFELNFASEDKILQVLSANYSLPIIDLQKTLRYFRNTYTIVMDAAAEGKTVLFTNDKQDSYLGEVHGFKPDGSIMIRTNGTILIFHTGELTIKN